MADSASYFWRVPDDGVPTVPLKAASPKYNDAYFVSGGTLAQAARLYFRVRALKITCASMAIDSSVTSSDYNAPDNSGNQIAGTIHGSIASSAPITIRAAMDWADSTTYPPDGDPSKTNAQNELALLAGNDCRGAGGCYVHFSTNASPPTPVDGSPAPASDYYQRDYSFARGGNNSVQTGDIDPPQPGYYTGGDYSAEFATGHPLSPTDPGDTGTDYSFDVGYGVLKFLRKDGQYYPAGSVLTASLAAYPDIQFQIDVGPAAPLGRVYLAYETTPDSDTMGMGVDGDYNPTPARTVIKNLGTCTVNYDGFKLQYNVLGSVYVVGPAAGSASISIDGSIGDITVTVDTEFGGGADAYWGWGGTYDTSSGQRT